MNNNVRNFHIKMSKQQIICEDTTLDTESDKEFIRKLANDFIHYKIYGKKTDEKNTNHLSPDRVEFENTRKPFCKTAKTLRKVSTELEKSHAMFFNNVCDSLNVKDINAEKTYQIVSEQVLRLESLNWGRVVSLFTFGGKLAEWFWETQQEEKIDDIEDWLTESLCKKQGWIEKNGGWEEFNNVFPDEEEETTSIGWLTPGLFVCGVGISLAALVAMK